MFSFRNKKYYLWIILNTFSTVHAMKQTPMIAILSFKRMTPLKNITGKS